MNDKTNNIIEQAIGRIETLVNNAEELSDELDAPNRVQLIDQLTALSTQAAQVKTEADLLALADGIHRLIEANPGLSALFEVPTEVGQRALTIDEFNKIVEQAEQPVTQDKVFQIDNHIHELREALQQSLETETPSSEPHSEKAGT